MAGNWVTSFIELMEGDGQVLITVLWSMVSHRINGPFDRSLF